MSESRQVFISGLLSRSSRDCLGLNLWNFLELFKVRVSLNIGFPFLCFFGFVNYFKVRERFHFPVF